MPPELVAVTGGMHNGRVVVFHRGITLESADLIPSEKPEAAGGSWIVPAPDDQRPITWLDNGELDGAERLAQAVEFTDAGELTAPLWSAPVETIVVGAVLGSSMTVHVSSTALRIWSGGLGDGPATIELSSAVVDATIADPYVLLVHVDGSTSAYQAAAAKRTLVAVDVSSAQSALRASLFADTRGSLPVLAPSKSVDGEAMEVDADVDGVPADVELDGFCSSGIKAKGRRPPSTIGRALEGLDRIRVSHLIAIATTEGHLQVRPS